MVVCLGTRLVSEIISYSEVPKVLLNFLVLFPKYFLGFLIYLEFTLVHGYSTLFFSIEKDLCVTSQYVRAAAVIGQVLIYRLTSFHYTWLCCTPVELHFL